VSTSRTLIGLSLLVVILAALYAALGLFSRGGEGPFRFAALDGETIDVYGRGVYHRDPAVSALIRRGTDAVTLLLAVPALGAAIVWYGRGSLRGRLLLAGMLFYFVYNSASLALGVFFNALFPIYVATLSASFYAFALAVSSVSLDTLRRHISERMPRLWMSAFLFLAGLSPLIWVWDIAVALAEGTVPANLGHYHTEVTYVLDLAFILPALYLAGVLVWRRDPRGLTLAIPLVLFMLAIGPVVVGQTVMMMSEGIAVGPPSSAPTLRPLWC
jgi:hypothetical protein